MDFCVNTPIKNKTLDTDKSVIKDEKGEINKSTKVDSKNPNIIRENIQLIISLGGFLLALCYYHYALYKIRIAEYWGYPPVLMNENPLLEGVRASQILILFSLIGGLVVFIYSNTKTINTNNIDKVKKTTYWGLIVTAFCLSIVNVIFAVLDINKSFIDTNFYSALQSICISCLLIVSIVIMIFKTDCLTRNSKGSKQGLNKFYHVPNKLIFPVIIILSMMLLIIFPFRAVKTEIENENAINGIQIVEFSNKYIEEHENDAEKFYIVSNDKDNFLLRKIIKCNENKIDSNYCLVNEYRNVKSEDIKKIINLPFIKVNNENKRLREINLL